MAKQVINIGTVANDGTGDPLRTAFDKANDNFTELYDASVTVDGLTIDYNGSDQLEVKDNGLEADKLKTSFAPSNGQYPAYNSTTGGFDWGYPNPSVDGTTIGYNGVSELEVKDDGISYDKMAAEFTTSAVLSASNVDLSTAKVFTKTLTANDTLTFSNVQTGMVKDLVITGNFTLTLPASVKIVAGAYDGTVSNLIQIVSTNGATEQWASISQEV